MKLMQGDCLKEYMSIAPGSIDLILADPPYGKMKGINAEGFGMSWSTEWDDALPPSKVHIMAEYLLRKNGKMVVFSQEPYTNSMIMGALPNLPFSYRMVWKKDHFANCLSSKKAPVSFYEDILIFSKKHQKHDFEGGHPLRPYFKYIFDVIGATKQAIIDRIGQRACHVFRFNTPQFTLCTKETYAALIQVYGIDKIEGFTLFTDLKHIDANFRAGLVESMNSRAPSVFNLWQGGKYKSNVLEYKKDYTGLHPTQKPVALMEDLIKTYTDPMQIVLDFSIGSGTTGVAAVRTGREFIGIELDEKYFNIARDRINLEIIGAS